MVFMKAFENFFYNMNFRSLAAYVSVFSASFNFRSFLSQEASNLY